MTIKPTGISADRDRLVAYVLEQKENPAADYITHLKIAEIIGVPYGSVRYRSVLAATIKVLRKQNKIHLASISGKGYTIGTSKDCVTHVQSGLEGTKRKMKTLNGVGNCAVNDELTNSERTELNAYRSIVGVISLFTSPSGIRKVHQIATDEKAAVNAGDLARLFGKKSDKTNGSDKTESA